jgi:uncharacterized protein with HEPN domain
MSSRNYKQYLQDMLEACDDIQNFTEGMKSVDDLQTVAVHYLQ